MASGKKKKTRFSSTVLRRAVAWGLKRARREASLSQADVASALGCRVPKVSLMESGQRAVQTSDLKILLNLYNIPQHERETWLEAAKCAHKKGWWERDDIHSLPEWLKHFIGLEQGAETLRSYQPGVIHGLLQTEEYAAAIARQTAKPVSEQMVRRNVEQKLRRQRVLDHDTDPLEVRAIIDESALRRVVGGHDVMQAQLGHLATIASQKPNVEIQILPLDRPGAFATSYGAFTILTLGWDTDPVVYIEQRTAAIFLDAIDETDAYAMLFEQLREVALSPDDSLSQIQRNEEFHSRET
jgi:transcriptional regulator with XRE-family HTH domain